MNCLTPKILTDPTLKPGEVLLIKAHKASQKERWTDHFQLQLRSYGFRVMPVGTLTLDDHLANRMCVFQEYRFHPERKWRLDFAIPALKLGIEIDGGIWRPSGGAHSRPANIQRDIEKANALTMLDWRLLRFSPVEIKSGESIRMTAVLATR